jgi:hypothetical protein
VELTLRISQKGGFAATWSVNVSDSVASLSCAPVARIEASGPEHCIAKRHDGVYADPTVLGTTLVAAVDSLLRDGRYFAGIDYPVLIKAMYGHGPELPRDAGGQPVVRFAADILPFDPERRKFYRSVKIADGHADYYFEPLYEPDPDNPGSERPARLDVDEFIADMWLKGIRFGIDVAAVREAIESGGAGRVVVARRLEPVPGQDAQVVEVSDDLHRSDAPRQLANGKLDLMSFQNRFPQVEQGVRLLRKVARTAGQPGFEMSAIVIEPEAPHDLDLLAWCGPGTTVERTGEGEFVVAQQAGFLNVDGQSRRLSVGDKIISHDGVSAKTTGNLQLSGDYEEFGEVQEMRVLEGESITLHANVFGHVVSRGGTMLLNANLVGGSARNANGDIRVKGVASSAVIQAKCGAVVLERAENCIVSGTRVTVAQAVNCEIIGDEVEVGLAEGCAVAGRHVAVGSAAPRRQAEMVVYALRPDCSRIEAAISQVEQRLAELGELAACHKAGIERLTGQPELRNYLMLASRVRKNEATLTPEQAPQFRKLEQAVGPALKELAGLSRELRAAEEEGRNGLALAAQLQRQRGDRTVAASVTVHSFQGDGQVRILPYDPDRGAAFDLPARDIKARLRGSAATDVLFAGASGAFSWSSEALTQPAA